LWNSWDSLTNHCFFGPGQGPTSHWPKKNFWDILFCPNGCKKNLGPNGWKAAEILDCLLHTESQSHTTSTPFSGGWNFLMPIFNKFPYSLRWQGGLVIFWTKKYEITWKCHPVFIH
jgi:hypothetical protein